jgi:ABC-type transport system substrate-binding protein
MRPRSLPIRSFVLLVLAWMVLLPAPAEAQTPKRGGTLRVSYGNEIANLDFHTAPGYEMMWVAMNVGCGLVNITPDSKFVGDAAETWTMSSDGLLYTFKLRKNVLFHDGTPVDAAAVKFNIERLMDPATKSGMRPFYEPVHSVEVVDPLTVQVRLKHPYAFFLHMLSAYRTGLILLSPASIQKFTFDDRRQGKPGSIVGCGPFKFVEWVKGSHLAMERFDKYFVPGLPYLDKVLIRVIKDPVTEMAAFKAGEVDFIASFSPEHVDTMKAQNPKAQIMTGKETTPMLAAMKVTVPKVGKPMSPDRAPHPIFGDLRVRKAIGCFGIDRQEIVKIAFKGQATPGGHGAAGHAGIGERQPPVPLRSGQGQGLARRGGLRPREAADPRADDEHREERVQRHRHRRQRAACPHRRHREHPAGGQGLLDEHDPGRRPVGHVHRGPPVPADHRQQRVSLERVRLHQVLRVEPPAPYRHQGGRLHARYAKELDLAKRKALAKEFLEYMAENMYYNVISGSPFYMVAQPYMKGYTYNAEFEVHYHKVWLDK